MAVAKTIPDGWIKCYSYGFKTNRQLSKEHTLHGLLKIQWAAKCIKAPPKLENETRISQNKKGNKMANSKNTDNIQHNAVDWHSFETAHANISML